MPFPLAAVLSAAPGVISAAADLIRMIREKKNPEVVEPDVENKIDSAKIHEEKIKELENLIERQAQLIEDLALNNSNLALAVKNNRILSVGSIALGAAAVGLAIWL